MIQLTEGKSCRWWWYSWLKGSTGAVDDTADWREALALPMRQLTAGKSCRCWWYSWLQGKYWPCRCDSWLQGSPVAADDTADWREALALLMIQLTTGEVLALPMRQLTAGKSYRCWWYSWLKGSTGAVDDTADCRGSPVAADDTADWREALALPMRQLTAGKPCRWWWYSWLQGKYWPCRCDSWLQGSPVADDDTADWREALALLMISWLQGKYWPCRCDSWLQGRERKASTYSLTVKTCSSCRKISSFLIHFFAVKVNVG
jgi:hypothetical protein